MKKQDFADIVQISFLLMASMIKAETSCTQEAAEKEALNRLNDSGIKCHMRKSMKR